ncbi:hypothetical protein LTR70_004326 [Exophiala xenobiotica]|uniref:Uncharacterized protein n=1 Tax=Lithohypha guttulata TaxID=1690604 RepID=A0ABR0KJ62_9EURO|nr:hypothetical protein LTR24_001903 [Lithohypha guttulata]KAK5320917.1 hypothetical protein LTR70_004326 [Exophiala xenobiotica]
MLYNVVGLPISYTQSGAQWKDQSRKVPRVLWRPKNPESTPMDRYRQHVNKKFKADLKTSHDLHRWSCEHAHHFWVDLYHYTEILPPLPASTQYAYNPNARFRDILTWFEGHKLNFAENLLMPNVRRTPNAIALTGL